MVARLVSNSEAGQVTAILCDSCRRPADRWQFTAPHKVEFVGGTFREVSHIRDLCLPCLRAYLYTQQDHNRRFIVAPA